MEKLLNSTPVRTTNNFKINDIIEWGKTFTDELGEEIKAKIEEITNNVKEAEENYAKN